MLLAAPEANPVLRKSVQGFSAACSDLHIAKDKLGT